MSKRGATGLAAGAFGIVLAFSQITAGAVTISDGTFNSADWTTQLFDADDASTVTVTQAATGGNPGPYQQLQFNLVAAYAVPPEYQPPFSIASDLGVVCVYNAASYDPGVSGAIAGLTFRMSTKDTNSDPKQVAQMAWVVYQAGVWYAGGAGFNTSGDYSWNQPQHISTASLSNSFEALDGSHPDFSAAGAPIMFGYVCIGLNDDTSAAHTHTLGVDNWSATITPVPEPATLSLLALGGLAMFRRRR